MTLVNCSCFWSGVGESISNVCLSINSDGIIDSIEKIDGTDENAFSFVMPSFVDAHIHYSWMVVKEISYDLSNISSVNEFLSFIESKIDNNSNKIVRFESFDESSWALSELPTLIQLDSVTGNVPVFCRRICGHAAIVNTAMLNLIEETVPNVNRKNGILTEWPVLNFEQLFPFSSNDLLKAVKAVDDMIYSKGVTAFCTFESEYLIDLFSQFPSKLDVLRAVIPENITQFTRLTNSTKLIKIFLDGSIGAGNAAMQYTSENSGVSFLHYSDDKLFSLLISCGKAGLLVAVHAIGSFALKQLDRVSNAVFDELGYGFDIRIEHAEDLMEAWPGNWNRDYHIFSMQPNFVKKWQNPGGMYDEVLSIKHSLKLNPFSIVKKAGFRLVFGSDGMPFDPLFGLQGAINHRNSDFSLSVSDAFSAYTVDAASVLGFKHLAEPLQIGRVADLVFLSKNPFIEMDGIAIDGTMKNGKFVYRKK